jgi:hypothetical protein
MRSFGLGSHRDDFSGRDERLQPTPRSRSTTPSSSQPFLRDKVSNARGGGLSERR